MGGGVYLNRLLDLVSLPQVSIVRRRPVVKKHLVPIEVMAGQGLGMFRINRIFSDMYGIGRKVWHLRVNVKWLMFSMVFRAYSSDTNMCRSVACGGYCRSA